MVSSTSVVHVTGFVTTAIQPTHYTVCNTQLHTEEHMTCVSHYCTRHITHVMHDIHKYAFYSLFKNT